MPERAIKLHKVNGRNLLGVQLATIAHSIRFEHEKLRQVVERLAWENLSCSRHQADENKFKQRVKWLAGGIVEGWKEGLPAARVQSFVLCHGRLAKVR